MEQTLQKLCIACGADVAGKKRVKNDGNYYCAECYAIRLSQNRADQLETTQAIPEIPVPGVVTELEELARLTQQTSAISPPVQRHPPTNRKMVYGAGGGILLLIVISGLCVYSHIINAGVDEQRQHIAQMTNQVDDKQMADALRLKWKADEASAASAQQVEVPPPKHRPTWREAIEADPQMTRIINRFDESDMPHLRDQPPTSYQLEQMSTMVTSDDLKLSDYQYVKNFVEDFNAANP